MYNELQNIDIKRHYYGDSIRAIFVITGISMVLFMPFFSEIINLPIIYSVIGVLILAIVGGVLNPKQFYSIFINMVVSIIGFAIFEYYAIYTYLELPRGVDRNTLFFWVNQIFALLFFVSTYLSVKSVRGRLVK